MGRPACPFWLDVHKLVTSLFVPVAESLQSILGNTLTVTVAHLRHPITLPVIAISDTTGRTSSRGKASVSKEHHAIGVAVTTSVNGCRVNFFLRGMLFLFIDTFNTPSKMYMRGMYYNRKAGILIIRTLDIALFADTSSSTSYFPIVLRNGVLGPLPATSAGISQLSAFVSAHLGVF